MKAMRKSIVVLIFIMPYSFSGVSAQAIPDNGVLSPKYGAFAEFSYIRYEADLRQLPSIPGEHPLYASDYGLGFNIGGLIEYPISKKTSFIANFFYSGGKAAISASDSAVLTSGSDIKPGKVNHIINSDISAIGIMPAIRFNIYKDIFLQGGFYAGYMFDKTISHSETVVSPSGAVFPDGLISHVIDDGNMMKKEGFRAALSGGIGWRAPVKKDGSLWLDAFIDYSTGFAGITDRFTLDVNSLSLGIGFRWSPIPVWHIYEPEPAEPIKEEEPEIMNFTVGEPPPPPSVISDSVYIEASLSPDGPVLPLNDITVEEFRTSNMPPLLNYIFFDENSDIIPNRYIRLSRDKASGFTLDKLKQYQTMPTYYHVLNIIGKRMQMFPGANLTVNGYNCDLRDENKNLALSEKRAEAVYKYLLDAWEIDPSRITLNSGNLPPRPSNSDNPDGIEENRRVEIFSDTKEITSPLISYDTVVISKHDEAYFYPKVNISGTIKDWRLDIVQGGTVLQEFSGTGAPPERLLWRINGDEKTVPKYEGVIRYQLTVNGEDGKIYPSASKEISTTKITIDDKMRSGMGDKKIETYGLILFDFNRSDLNDENKRILRFISGRLEDKSEIKIEGMTDRVGDPEYNRALSEERAKSTAAELKVIAGKNINLEYKGLGEDILPYSNDTPEGRFYCRTVKIIVETPLSE